jgi:hypothetical protein
MPVVEPSLKETIEGSDVLELLLLLLDKASRN